MDSQPITLSTELGELIELTRHLEETARSLVPTEDFEAARQRVAQRLQGAQTAQTAATRQQVA